MKERANSAVIVLLAFATLVGFTSAMRDDDLLRMRDGGAGSTATPTESLSTGDLPESQGDFGSDGQSGPETQDADSSEPERAALEGSGDGDRRSRDSSPQQTNDGTPVRIAYLVPDNSSAGTFGIQTDNTGDGTREDREFSALIDWANAAGGIAGHPIEGRRFTVDLAEQLDENRLVQRCVEISEDYGADYVIDTHIMGYPSTQQCFAQRGVVLVGLSFGINDDMQQALVPHFATTLPTIDRIFAALVPQLQSAGYLADARIGVFLNEDNQLERPYEELLEPALRRAGAKPAAVARAGPNDQAAISNAVLTFRSAGVTHVIFVGSILHIAGFSNVAEGQGYRPRYAFTDYYSSNVTAPLVAPDAQMRDAVGVSALHEVVREDASRASDDLSSPYDRGRVTPGFAQCLDTLSEARQANYWRPGEAGASTAFPLVCDHFLLWLQGMRAGGGQLTPDAFHAGLRSVADRYQSARVQATDFADGRQSGATHFATGGFDRTCRCYVRENPWAPA